MVRTLFPLLVFVFGFVFGFSAKADVMFEAYSKVLSGGVHIGYAIVRYEFDPKKKQFLATTFLKTNEFGGNLTESLKATAAEDFRPISYQYTMMTGNDVKTIDARFDGLKMSANVKNGSKNSKITKTMPKGTFLSSFLGYVILKSPTGLKAESKYDYQGIAEEDAEVYKGIALVKGQEDYAGFKAFRVLNEFKSAKFISFMSEKGEVFATRSPAQSISTEVVASPSQATAQFQIPTATLKTLFGDVPTGQKNDVSRKAQAGSPNLGSPTVTPSKMQGVPGGQGIQLKGGGTPPSPEAGH